MDHQRYAFPHQFPAAKPDLGMQHPGLTMREYFAGLAMQGMAVNFQATPENAAKKAIEYADALIRELAKK